MTCAAAEVPWRAISRVLAGLATFRKQGFVVGDPRPYFHPPHHPHVSEPRYGVCEGCSPPVHGQPALVRNLDGVVHVQTGEEECKVQGGQVGNVRKPPCGAVRVCGVEGA